jgi:hypothetical protein
VDGSFAGTDDDGDGEFDEPLPPGTGSMDCDGDGAPGSAEQHVYSYKSATDGDQKVCGLYDASFPDAGQPGTPSLGWPVDFVQGGIPDSTLLINLQDLTSFLAPVRYMGSNVGTRPGDVRWDLDPGKGTLTTDINLQDLTKLLAGPSAYPPMLGGERAFNGPTCPWP